MDRPQPLPRTRAVDRERFLVRSAGGRRIIHVGFCDFETRERFGLWLHGRLSKSARQLVGIDVDVAGVEQAVAEGFEAYAADCTVPEDVRKLNLEPAEIVIAGEVIEHVDDPGGFLDAMHLLGDRLIVTTPNAASLLNVVGALRHMELIHPDHVSWFSAYTLTNLMRRHGWHVESMLAYHMPRSQCGPNTLEVRAGRALTSLQRVLARRWPFIDAGLIAVARSTTGSGV
jgi:hypothetical protein